MISGWTIFSMVVRQEVAEGEQWIQYIHRNILKGIRIIIEITSHSSCIFCHGKPLIIHGSNSLENHYKVQHFNQTTNHILHNLIPLNSDELEELILS